MMQALALAWRGFGRTQPNPIVGAVVVRDGRGAGRAGVVGRGYHHRFGGPHAEVLALREAGRLARGATLYVTLDPCCVQGKTPPCTAAIINSGVIRVVSAIADPHDRRGAGARALRDAGILFERFGRGVIHEQACASHQFFFKIAHGEHRTHGERKKRGARGEQLPYVIMKTATTLDGSFIVPTGHGRYMTNHTSLTDVHRLRSCVDAIIVGSGTVRADNPHLGVRHVRGRDPYRIILDSTLSVSPTAQVFRDERAIVFTTDRASPRRIAEFCRRGIAVEILENDSKIDLENGAEHSRIDLSTVLRSLYARGMYIVLIETGSTLASAFIEADLVDRYIQYVAPVWSVSCVSSASAELSAIGSSMLLYPSMASMSDDWKVDGYLRWY